MDAAELKQTLQALVGKTIENVHRETDLIIIITKCGMSFTISCDEDLDRCPYFFEGAIPTQPIQSVLVEVDSEHGALKTEILIDDGEHSPNKIHMVWHIYEVWAEVEEAQEEEVIDEAPSDEAKDSAIVALIAVTLVLILGLGAVYGWSRYNQFRASKKFIPPPVSSIGQFNPLPPELIASQITYALQKLPVGASVQFVNEGAGAKVGFNGVPGDVTQSELYKLLFLASETLPP